ncbi:MAG: hypothetical protein LBU17_12325 [Treponema sp.]|nr:hypothetical protein [Treponema sp.]
MLNYILLLFPIALFVLIVYFALSRKSSPLLRRVALIVLIIIGFSIILSLCIILSEPAASPRPVIADLPPDKPVQPQQNNLLFLVVFSIFFLLFIAIVAYISIRDQRRKRR